MLKRISNIILLLLLTISVSAQKPLPQLGKDKIEDVIAAMTLEEKVYLLVGIGDSTWRAPVGTPGAPFLDGQVGQTWGIPRLGIIPTILTDGPAGLRISVIPKDNTTLRRYCTAFPTATALSSTWNTTLVENVGKTMGNETLEYGSDVLLSPAINIHRNPLCGRNFEYFSEDPYISGKMGAAIVKGIQANGIGSSLKHFAANNIETNRKTINAVIGQRALREIYLRGFEIVVKEAQPWTIMTSYNRLNGFYTSENPNLTKTILRDEWGFEGMVVSDWWGGADGVAQMKAGNELLMPGSYQREEIFKALKNKTLSEKVIDQNVARVLKFISRTPHQKGFVGLGNPDLAAHAFVSREAATEGMVLLKNNTTLPFKKVKKVALFGKTSYRYIAGGTGSGEVNYKYASTISESFKTAGYKVAPALEKVYTEFIDSIKKSSKDTLKKFVVDFHPEMAMTKSSIEAQVKINDLAIITLGRNAGEEHDIKVTDFSLTETEKLLIRQVTEAFHAAKKKVVVILNIGSVITTADWRDYPDAILLGWQSGQEGANAIIDILSGKVNPSAKLPMTFPMKYDDIPSAKTFPGEPMDNPVNAIYNEGIYVGYRYYDSFKVPTAYEFGFGLSYTTFEYSDLQLSSKVFSNEITVKVKIKNTGKKEGKEVVQLYLSAPSVELEKPLQELKNFAKTKKLKPGESEEIAFTLDKRALSSFWASIPAWVAEKGIYEVRIGASSKDIRLKSNFELPETLIVEKTNDVLYPNRPVKEISAKK